MDNDTLKFILQVIVPIISALIVGIIGPIIIYQLKSESLYLFSAHLKEMKDVDFIVSSLCNTVGASRTFILNYHNGGRFYSGKPRQKVSMSYEKAPGKQPFLKDYQDVPISYFSVIAYELDEVGEVQTEHVDSMIDGPYKRLMKENGVKSQLSLAFYQKKLSAKALLHGKLHVKRMVSSIHFWFENPREQMSVKDNVIFDKQIDELKEILTK